MMELIGRRRIVRSGRPRNSFVFRCGCGAEVVRDTEHWSAKSCMACYIKSGCRRAPAGTRAQPGDRFGKLVVKRRDGRRAVVACDCGSKEKFVEVSNLTSGVTRSCGCLWEHARIDLRTHGASKTPEYRIYSGMLQRCLNQGAEAFRWYGARGVRVSEEWLGDGGFERFLAHIGHRPSPEHSIDRIDNDGNYEPGNVRWATDREQLRNTSRNVWLEHNGRRMLATDWAAELGISRQAIEQRIRRGWPAERICSTGAGAISRSLRGRAPGSELLEFGGVSDTITGWSRRLGVSRRALIQRIKRGHPLEVVFTAGPIPRELRKKAVRPKGIRRRVRAHKPYACSICGVAGHNRATCSNQIEAA